MAEIIYDIPEVPGEYILEQAAEAFPYARPYLDRVAGEIAGHFFTPAQLHELWGVFQRQVNEQAKSNLPWLLEVAKAHPYSAAAVTIGSTAAIAAYNWKDILKWYKRQRGLETGEKPPVILPPVPPRQPVEKDLDAKYALIEAGDYKGLFEKHPDVQKAWENQIESLSTYLGRPLKKNEIPSLSKQQYLWLVNGQTNLLADSLKKSFGHTPPVISAPQQWEDITWRPTTLAELEQARLDFDKAYQRGLDEFHIAIPEPDWLHNRDLEDNLRKAKEYISPAQTAEEVKAKIEAIPKAAEAETLRKADQKGSEVENLAPVSGEGALAGLLAGYGKLVENDEKTKDLKSDVYAKYETVLREMNGDPKAIVKIETDKPELLDELLASIQKLEGRGDIFVDESEPAKDEKKPEKEIKGGKRQKLKDEKKGGKKKKGPKNPWQKFVEKYSKDHKIDYWDAIKSAEVQKAYKNQKSAGIIKVI